MDERQEELRQRARNSVFRLLKIRLRSEAEIRDKLALKNIPPAVIDETVRFLTEIGLINDSQFAKEWTLSRLKRSFGINRIRFELKKKGIAQEIIDDAVANASGDYPELNVVLSLARRRYERYRGLDRTKARQRVLGYLRRRGFNNAIIYKAINKL